MAKTFALALFFLVACGRVAEQAQTCDAGAPDCSSDGGTPDAGSPDAGADAGVPDPTAAFVGTWYGQIDFGNGGHTNWGPAIKVTALASDRVQIEYLTGGGYCPMTGSMVTAPCQNCTPGQPHVTIDWSAPCPSSICYEQSYTYIPTGFVLVTGGAKLTVAWRSGQTCNPIYGYDPTRRWVLSSDVLTRQ